jgi:RHS repeat-associated protein
VSKETGGVATTYVWDGDILLHETTGGSPPVTWYHAPDSFEPIARFDGDRWHHIVTDQVGAPLAVYAEDGTPVWEGQMDTYGALCPPPVDGQLCPWRWPGQYHDEETGLALNGWRYYDSSLGQYISKDPLGIEGGLALYAYVHDPLTWIDPLGLSEGGYEYWQIHSPGYPDVVQKGLHFYTPQGVELSVRPDHQGGITFARALGGGARNPRLQAAVAAAKNRFGKVPGFSADILAKARHGISATIEHSRNLPGSLREKAIGRSREMREIVRNLERKGGCG